MTPTLVNPLARLRHALALPRARALFAALAVAVFGTQLALQTHLAGHDLAAADGPCAYALHVQHLTPLAAAPAAVSDDPARHAAPEVTQQHFALDRTPLVERSRGPPSFLV